MKQIVKKHPLREISYRADTSKEASQAEREGLEAYERFHDRVFELKVKFDQQSDELFEVETKIAGLAYSLKILTHHLTHLEHYLGINTHPPLPPQPDDFSTNLQVFRNRALTYTEDLERVSQDFLTQFENQGEMIETVGALSNKAEDDMLLALGKLLDSGDPSLCVDVSSLREDFESYAETQKEILDQQKKFMDSSREVTTQYVQLRKDSEKVFERAYRLLDEEEDEDNFEGDLMS